MRTRSFVAGLLLTLSTVVAAAATDAKPGVLVARIQILSQQLPLVASDAASGNADAFSSLKRTHDEIAALVAQLKQDEKDTGRLERAWLKLSTDVSKILEGQLVVKASGTNADEFEQKIPLLNSRTDEVARLLADHAASGTQVLVVVRQELLAERMRRRIQSIRQGGEESSSAADGLTRDAMFYGTVLDGLIKGNADLGLKALKDASARTILADIDTQWTQLAPVLAKLVGTTPALQSVREATDNVRIDSSTLLLEAEPLFRHYNN